MAKIRRHSSHPEIWVGEKKMGKMLFILSAVCFIASLFLILCARNIVRGGDARIQNVREKLNDLKDKADETEHICDLAILTCKKN